MKKQSCMFCGAPATLLCDGVIGYDADEDINGMMTGMPRKIHTCDAPMCRDCAAWQGNIFWHGPSSGMDTKDHCPICVSVLQITRMNIKRMLCSSILVMARGLNQSVMAGEERGR
uniref:hypothetical protein n=1 Tax=Hafnia alvei TaxID=569 RepID=UPI00266B8099|nr:hypothetical protein [Hafnia alvei]